MNIKGQIRIDEIVKAFFALIVGIIIIGAFADVFSNLDIPAFSSGIISLTILAIIVAFIIQVLKEIGVFR